MKNNNQIRINPKIFFGYEIEDLIPESRFNAVLSRAGVGKTSFIVQVALAAMINNRKVLHISLDDPVKKISLWYNQIFNMIAEKNNIQQADMLFESLLAHRFIMTFKVDSCSVPRLSERLNDLLEQNIFSPDMMIIDGLRFDSSVRKSLIELLEFTNNNSINAWFTVRTHRHEDPGPGIIPSPLSEVSDLFDVVMQLRPDGKNIHVLALKGSPEGMKHHKLQIDPSTMLIQT